MNEDENSKQDGSTDYLEGADIDDNVTTLQKLKQRRQKLLLKKKQILENQRPDFIELTPVQPAVCSAPFGDTVSTADFTTVGIDSRYDETVMGNTTTSATPTVNVNLDISLPDESFNFGSDDSVADPTYVPLLDITNVQPLDNLDIGWFPERAIEPEVSSASRTRKRKADRQNWMKIKNQKNRMLGKEYVGYKKNDNMKYVQDAPKPKRTLGPKCNSPFCLRSKTLFCAQISEEERQEIFQTFWSRSWKEKKLVVCSMIDVKTTQRKMTAGTSRRLHSKEYHLQIQGVKKRVCLKTFLSTLGIKEWTVRYWLGDRNQRQLNEVTNVSLSLETKRLSIKSYLSNLPKLPSHYCRKSSTKQYLEPIIQSKSELTDCTYSIVQQQTPCRLHAESSLMMSLKKRI